MADLRAERAAQKKDAVELLERLKVAQDKAEYLVQFSPQSSNLVRLATLWTQPLESCGAYSKAITPDIQTRPFATLLVQPTQLSALLDTFFSLTNQNFSGWELVLLVGKDISPGLLWAVDALCRLDQRVVVVAQDANEVNFSLPGGSTVRGEYWMRLPEGATLAFNALEAVVTLARDIPGIDRIGFDFERSMADASQSMRCYTYAPFAADRSATTDGSFDAMFLRLEGNGQLARQLGGIGYGKNDAHIPLLLVQLNTSQHHEDAPVRATIAFLLEQNRQLSDASRHWKGGRTLRWLRGRAGRFLRAHAPAPVWGWISRTMAQIDRSLASRSTGN
jgi:hypothetical protein